MFDYILLGIIVIAALMALRHPWIGVMLWTWISLMNPHRYSEGSISTAPLAAIAAGATLLGLLMTRDRQSPFLGAPTKWLLVCMIWITLSWLLGYDVDGDYYQWNKVMKILFMTFVALMLLTSRHHIMAFIWVATMSLAILGIKGGIFTVLHGGSYRVWGPPGSSVYDNNEFALALVTIIPLLHFLQLQLERPWARHLLSVGMLLCAVSALGSHSRGGMLALLAMGGLLWWRSPRKGVMTVALIVVIGLTLSTLPQEWWDRMGTIGTYGEDASVMGRMRSWKVALQVALHHITGAGMGYMHPVIFAMWDVEQGQLIAAHSIYFQILGNHGFIGLFLFLMTGASTYHYAGWLRRHARNIPEAQWAADLGNLLQVSMVGFAFGGAFLSLAYYDFIYDLLLIVVAARHWVETRGWEVEPERSFFDFGGLRKHKGTGE
jgi:probable O-glycosylation ligase (exosortase A-associated)